MKSAIVTTFLPPEGYEAELSEYRIVLHDGCCGEPIGWGFLIRRHLGEDRFNALGEYGDLECITAGSWCLVVRWLTPEEAVAQYGKVTAVERGPRGGFKSITYGAKRFLSRRLAGS